MKKLFYTFVVVGLLSVSCKKEETTVENDVATTDSIAVNNSEIQPVVPNADGTNPNTVMLQNGGTAVTPQASANGQASVQQNGQPMVVGKGMNPAHGQPGHRCDIPVGSPLNSPPGKSNPSQTITQKQVVTPEQLQGGQATVNPINPAPSANAAPVVTAPGMNPPHGQDGHVCSVAVGAPLPK